MKFEVIYTPLLAGKCDKINDEIIRIAEKQAEADYAKKYGAENLTDCYILPDGRRICWYEADGDVEDSLHEENNFDDFAALYAAFKEAIGSFDTAEQLDSYAIAKGIAVINLSEEYVYLPNSRMNAAQVNAIIDTIGAGTWNFFFPNLEATFTTRDLEFEELRKKLLAYAPPYCNKADLADTLARILPTLEDRDKDVLMSYAANQLDIVFVEQLKEL